MSIETGINLSTSQRALVNAHGFDVAKGKNGELVITSDKVSQVFGKAAGTRHGKPDDLNRMIMAMVSDLNLAIKHPARMAEEKAKMLKNGAAASETAAPSDAPPKKKGRVLPAKTAETAAPAEAAAPTKTKAKAKAKAKAKTPAKNAATDWLPEFADTAKLTILAKECPRRPGTGAAAHWALYKNGMTIAELRAAGGIKSKVETDTKKKHIKVG